MKSCIILAMLAGITANGATLRFQSSEQQTPLLELYTSEGCSSCPPAESWLSKLKEAPGLWSDFVPVAFHVDYWDYLGWRDKLSNKLFSDRQRDYAAAWGAANIYTPEFVLGGKEWHYGLGMKGAPGPSGTKAGILKASSEDMNHWQVNFSPAANGTTGYEVNAALLICGLGSEVSSGENAGRHLKHDFAVVTLVNQTLVKKDGGFQGAFDLPAGSKTYEGKLALAVWVTPVGSLEPVQAAGGWLAGEPAK